MDSDRGQTWSFNQPVLLNKTRRNSTVLVWTLVVATGVGTSWAILAPLPETVVVRGKLQPLRPAQAITAPVAAVVDQVEVKEGQRVDRGDLLLRFDTQSARSRLESARNRHSSLVQQVHVNQVLLQERALADLTAEELQLYRNQSQEQQGNAASEAAALARSQVRIRGLRRSLAAAETVFQRYEQLQRAGASSELQVLLAREKVDTLRADLEAEQREEDRLAADNRARNAGRSKTLRKEITIHEQQMDVLTREMREAQLLLESSSITAPARGVVFDLGVRSGSVVQRGDTSRPLLRLVPDDALQAKVYLPNSAIGFIKTGQPADISLNAFPASDFSDLPATVLRIGSDALTPEQQRQELGVDVQGLHFPAVLKLERQTLLVDGKDIPLHAGMSLNASLQLRNRRFISAITGLFDEKRRSLEQLR